MLRKKTLRVTLFSLILVIILISSLVIYVGYSFYFGPLPQTSGVIVVRGLQAPVTIYRDSWAISQVFASNTNDLFFSQGYAHAQDRWWQMEISRYLGMGRLRDILTDDEIVWAADQWMLTLGLAESARQEWENAPPETRTLLEAYSAGVNAYIESRSIESLASEYGLVGLTGEIDSLLIYLGRDVAVEAWEPYHSILLWKLYALSTTPSFWTALDLAWVLQRDDSGSLLKLINSTSALQSLPINPALMQLDATEIGTLREQAVGGVSPELMVALGFPMVAGGNLWVVDGQHTDTGLPLLANDLHMSPEIPSAWYEMNLQCNTIQANCPYAVTGLSMAGVPGIVQGHNDQIAWGINPSRANVQALTVLDLNPENPMQYWHDGEWHDFVVETIPFRAGDETEDEDVLVLEHQVIQSIYGPVITEPVGEYALALSWAGFESDSDTIGSLLQINRASGWTAFQNAARGWVYPVMQFVYTDISGNIGLQMVGSASNDVGTPIAFSDLPSLYNPASGIIIDANQVPPDLSLAGYWEPAWRADRVEELILGQNSHTPDSFASFQGDSYNPIAFYLMPYLMALAFDDPELEAIQLWLSAWDFQYTIESPQAAFFAVFADTVVQLAFSQELQGAELSLYDLSPLLLNYLLPLAVDNIWDTPETILVEGRDDVLRTAFRSTYEQMVEQFGEDIALWRWGDLHQVTFISRVIGQEIFYGGNLALNSGLFPINQNGIDIGGSFGSINHTRYTLQSPVFDKTVENLILRVHTVPASRVIIDLADFNNSRAMLSTGQSGHPASGNYKDMIAPWRTLDYHDLQWTLAAIREVSDKRLELEPEPESR